jgi:hypothetical protein
MREAELRLDCVRLVTPEACVHERPGRLLGIEQLMLAMPFRPRPLPVRDEVTEHLADQ